MSIFTGIKLGLHWINRTMVNTNFYGCLERYEHHFEPLRIWLLEKNKEYIELKQMEHVLDTPELLEKATIAAEYLQAWKNREIAEFYLDAKKMVEFNPDKGYIDKTGENTTALYVYFVCRMYSPTSWTFEKVSDEIGRFRIERSFYHYAYNFIENLIAYTPF